MRGDRANSQKSKVPVRKNTQSENRRKKKSVWLGDGSIFIASAVISSNDVVSDARLVGT